MEHSSRSAEALSAPRIRAVEVEAIRQARVLTGGQRLLLLASLLCAVLLVAVASGWSPKKVTIVDESGEPIGMVTWGRSVGDALARAEVSLASGDRVVPDIGAPLQPGMEVRILRGFPLSLQVDGASRTLQAVRVPVSQLLLEAGIALGPLDRVTPDPDTAAAPGVDIRVIRVREEIVTLTEPIPFSTTRWAAPDLVRGRTRVVRAGVPGLLEKTVRVRLEDGQEVERAKLAEQRLKEPAAQIIGVGTRPPALAVQTPQGLVEYTRVLDVEATAYYPGPDSTGDTDGLTATGVKAGRGIVAVDPAVIPLGSKLYIPGYGTALAADTGGAIKGRRIDVCFETYDEAIQYGRRPAKVYILAQH